MRVDTYLDLDVVALEQDDTLTLMLALQAPDTPDDVAERPAHTVVVCLDRSGSMSGDRLESARAALLALVDRLDARDRIGVVSFDDRARVEVPAGPLGDLGRDRVRRAIREIRPGGMTDLSSGYLLALREAKRVAGPTGATVVLLSDGQANAGVTDDVALRSVAAEARREAGVTTSTIGIGLGYDERILAALAEGGSGNHAMAEHPEAAATALAAEVAGLLTKTVQAVSLAVRPGPGVTGIDLLNDLPASAVGDQILIDLGDFYAGEDRRLLLRLHVPAIASLGAVTVADLELRYVELPALVEHVVRWPVSVNVVPGDEAAGRVRAPEVEQEQLLLDAQAAKRAGEEAVRHGDVEGARAAMMAGLVSLGAAPAPNAAVVDEMRWFSDSLSLLSERDAHYNAKRMRASHTKAGRGYRSRSTGGEVPPSER